MSIVCPGEVVTGEAGYLRGHGTHLVHQSSLEADDSNEPKLVASLSGCVERVNRLISVRPPNSRYTGEVGDLVIGRVTEVGSKRWKVDIGAHQDAVLQLSSVNLPGGAQRKRTSQDQLEMRTLFIENDLISAEVQQVNSSDGAVALHTRSLRYGKLENGRLVCVPQSRVRRLKQHFVTLDEIGVDILLGTNGWIWVTRTSGKASDGEDVLAPDSDTLAKLRAAHVCTPIEGEDRQRICRVCNSIVALRQVGAGITPESIMHVYAHSLAHNIPVQSMLSPESINAITTHPR